MVETKLELEENEYLTFISGHKQLDDHVVVCLHGVE